MFPCRLLWLLSLVGMWATPFTLSIMCTAIRLFQRRVVGDEIWFVRPWSG
jgi:hypothetical protein